MTHCCLLLLVITQKDLTFSSGVRKREFLPSPQSPCLSFSMMEGKFTIFYMPHFWMFVGDRCARCKQGEFTVHSQQVLLFQWLKMPQGGGPKAFIWFLDSLWEFAVLKSLQLLFNLFILIFSPSALSRRDNQTCNQKWAGNIRSLLDFFPCISYKDMRKLRILGLEKRKLCRGWSHQDLFSFPRNSSS